MSLMPGTSSRIDWGDIAANSKFGSFFTPFARNPCTVWAHWPPWGLAKCGGAHSILPQWSPSLEKQALPRTPKSDEADMKTEERQECRKMGEVESLRGLGLGLSKI